MSLTEIFKVQKVKPSTILSILLICFDKWVIATPIIYTVFISITNPPPTFWSQSYSSTVIFEVLIAIVLSIMNAKGKKYNFKLNKKENDKNIEFQIANTLQKPQHFLIYFGRRFFLDLGFFALFNFAYLIYLSPDQKIFPSVMIQSAIFGGIISLILGITRFRKLYKLR